MTDRLELGGEAVAHGVAVVEVALLQAVHSCATRCGSGDEHKVVDERDLAGLVLLSVVTVTEASLLDQSLDGRGLASLVLIRTPG